MQNLIWCGVFNLVMNPDVDRFGSHNNNNETVTLAGKGLLFGNTRIFLHFQENACISDENACISNENVCIFLEMHAFSSNLHKMHAFSVKTHAFSSKSRFQPTEV